VILKRFEVWLLLAVVAALLVFAFLPEPAPEPAQPGRTSHPTLSETPAPEPSAAEPETAPAPGIVLRNVRVLESLGGLIVETTLAGRAPSGDDLLLDEANVSATADDGEPVPRFFEPFRETASLSGAEDSLATLRWWLARPATALSLD